MPSVILVVGVVLGHDTPSEALAISLAATSQLPPHNSYGDNRQLITLDSATTGCLDGSPYKFYIWPGNSSDWSVFIQGGGWCLDEELCKTRAMISARGSSKGYNITYVGGPTSAISTAAPRATRAKGLTQTAPECTCLTVTDRAFPRREQHHGQ